MSTRILLAALAATVVGFFGGWLIWGIALESYFKSQASDAAIAMERSPEEFVWWAVILAQFAWGLLLAWVLSKSGDKSVVRGAITGAILIGLVSLGIDLSFYGMTRMYNGFGPVIVDVLANIVFGAIIGAIVGWVLGMGRKEPESQAAMA